MLKIRKFRRDDEEALRQICRDTTCRINIEEYGPELVEKWASRLADRSKWKRRIARKNPFVAENGGAIVGFAELTPEGQISAFYSHYRWQGKGVGSLLLEAIELEADERGIDGIQVESSMRASPFFQRRGFRVVEEKETLTDGIRSKSVLLVKGGARQPIHAPS